MINHIISECSKLALKEYKTRYDRVGKVGVVQELKFNNNNNNNPTRRPDLVLISRKRELAV